MAKLVPLDLFIELTRRRLAFKIIALLTKHNELLTSELIIMLDHRYSEETIKRALTYLLRNDLVRKIRRGHSRIIMLNAENDFVTKLTNFVRTLHEKDLWDVFEKTFLGTRSRIKAVMALMNGAMVKTELAKECKIQGGTPTDLMLKPLISHEIVIEHKGRRRVEYELNRDHPLNQVLMEFLREIGVDGNRNNNRNNGNKDMYHMLAKEFVDYIIEHWDDYIINPYRKDTIKLTGVIIRSIATKIAEKKGWKITHPGWLVDFIIEEFIRRGFCVMVKKFGQRPNITKVKVYVSKTCNGGE
jgi:hypothetical protein